MKAAVVLFAHSPSLAQQAGEINKIMGQANPELSCVELWLFYSDTPPDLLPEIHGPLSAVQCIRQEHPHLPEAYLDLLEALMAKNPVDLLLFNSDGLGRELATRLAFRLKGSACLQVQELAGTFGQLEVTKPVYGNHLEGRFVLRSPPYCLSVARQPHCPAKMTRKQGSLLDPILMDQPSYAWMSQTLTVPDPPDTSLADADLVLVVGQGVNSKETVDMLQKLAHTLGGHLGASRPVVMNAWAEMNRLIGVSGMILSPKICIVAGVSGTGVFRVGIQNSEFIVAINTDPQAPIFQIAHVGIVGDLEAVLEELAMVIQADRAKKMGSPSPGPGSGTE